MTSDTLRPRKYRPRRNHWLEAWILCIHDMPYATRANRGNCCHGESCHPWRNLWLEAWIYVSMICLMLHGITVAFLAVAKVATHGETRPSSFSYATGQPKRSNTPYNIVRFSAQQRYCADLKKTSTEKTLLHMSVHCRIIENQQTCRYCLHKDPDFSEVTGEKQSNI